jgi:hypothetical protein
MDRQQRLADVHQATGQVHAANAQPTEFCWAHPGQEECPHRDLVLPGNTGDETMCRFHGKHVTLADLLAVDGDFMVGSGIVPSRAFP